VSTGIRQAASLILGRDAEGGLEVLVLERAMASRFLPGYVAFPGGSVDAEDRRLAERWFAGEGSEARATVLRELVEECGLALTALGVTRASHTGAIDAAPPKPAQIVEVARWIAPEEVPVRFDARYFAAVAGAGADPTPDGTETTEAWWISPHVLLEDWEQERRKLYWPTYYTVRAIAKVRSAAELMRLRIETREPTDEELEWLHRSTFYED
jgi:8-oxo-dGTP pyrophosphatase MutT (NUDIX family)